MYSVHCTHDTNGNKSQFKF